MTRPPMTEAARERWNAEVQTSAHELEKTPEGMRAAEMGGATLHNYLTGLDAGERYVITGADAYGKRMRREAGSIAAVHAIMTAAWGYKRAWHVRPDGTRRRVYNR